MMDSIYQKLNKKLDALQEHKSHGKNNKETMKYAVHTRLVNLTQKKLSSEQINALNLGFDCAVEKTQKSLLTLCRSYLKAYCTGRKTTFFSAGI
jgi:hypothetical protein